MAVSLMQYLIIVIDFLFLARVATYEFTKFEGAGMLLGSFRPKFNQAFLTLYSIQLLHSKRILSNRNR